MRSKINEKIRVLISGNELQTQIIKRSTGSFFIYIIFAALSLAISMILARILGADGYGAYANAIAWSNLLIPFATFGLTTLLVRDISIFRAQENWPLMKGLLKFSDQFVFILSIIVMMVFYGINLVLFSGPDKQLMFKAILIALPLIPLWAFAYLRQSSIRGLENATKSLIPDMVIRPGLLLGFILLVFFLWPFFLNINTVMVISVSASALALFLAAYWLKIALPIELKTASPVFKIRSWIKTSFPLFIFGSMQIALPQIPVIMLGVLSSADHVGFFSATYRLANTLAFLPGAVSIVMNPIIARLYAQNETKKLQKLLTITVQGTFVLDLLIGLTFIILRKPFLSLFGNEFITAQWAFVILIISNVLDALMGNTTSLLSMIGKEKVVARTYVVIIVLNIILNLIFIPNFGYMGAILVSSICLLLIKAFFSIYTVKKIGLNTTIIVRNS